MDYLVEAFNAERKVNNEYIAVLLQKMKALEAAAPKWISVEETLPEKTGKYIVCTAKKSVYCTRFVTCHGGGDFMTDSNTHITHWMKLPEPPEVK